MLTKFVAFLAALVLLFVSAPELPQPTQVLVENLDGLAENRIADEINGAAGTVFYIQRPLAEKLNTVNAADFGVAEDNECNFAALQAAFDYCALNPGTRLVIDKGTYKIKNNRTLVMNGFSDIVIDGGGATLIFETEGYKIAVVNSDCVEVRNLSVDWSWETDPLASVVTVSNASPESNTLDLVFNSSDSASEDTALMAITQCDPETFTFGAKASGKEVYLYQDAQSIQAVEKTADNTLRITHNGCMDGFENGETYILRHHVYGGTVFQLAGGSSNITFDGVNIYGSAGMAFICEGNASHFQIVNSFIGVNPEYKNERCVSATADAIHIANSGGCFNISGCDISGMGDDAVNVHDGLGYVSAVGSNTATLIASAMRLEVGDTLGFKNKKFENTDITAKIVSVKNLEGITKEVVFDRDVSEEIATGYVAYSKECNSGNYVISNNIFHEHRARGLLLQSGNGLCENNRFYKIMGQAIRVVMDIQPTLWQEGTGADNIVIRNNTFELCDYSGWGTVIEIGTNIAGQSAETAVFSNIEISSNTFVNVPSYVLKANNVNGLAFADNTIDVGSDFEKSASQGRLYFYGLCENVKYSGNTWTDAGFLNFKEIAKAENLSVWAQINSQL